MPSLDLELSIASAAGSMPGVEPTGTMNDIVAPLPVIFPGVQSTPLGELRTERVVSSGGSALEETNLIKNADESVLESSF